MATRDWALQEAGWAEASGDLRIAFAAGRRRWVRTLLVATVLTGAVLYWRATRPPRFSASIVVRVTEPGFDEDTKPPSSGELGQYVHEVFLTRSTLITLIEDLGLYPEKMGPDPSLAIDEMRADLDIRVVQNYFSPERYMVMPVRSARIVIEYLGRTPDEAITVVRELGKRFAARQARHRQLAAAAAAYRVQTKQRSLYANLRTLSHRQAELNVGKDESPLALVQLLGVDAQSRALEAALDEVSGESARQRLRGELEQRELGMRFDLVDTGQRPTPLLTATQALVVTGVMGFALLLPLSALGFGALSPRVVGPDRVARLGLTALGQMPWPPQVSPRRRA